MLDSTSKLYERMILNSVQSELADPENEWLSEMQYGFRAGRSTSNVVQEVQKSVDKAFSMKPKPGGFCAVVTLDVNNVFNMANWEHIYQALNRRLPIYLMRVVSSYLEDSNERTRQLPYWTSKEKHRQPYFKSGKMNGTHTLKAGGDTRLVGMSKSGQHEITEDSITGLRRHSVDMSASAPTYSSIKSEVIQPASTVGLDRMTRHTRSFAAESTWRNGTNCNRVLAPP